MLTTPVPDPRDAIAAALRSFRAATSAPVWSSWMRYRADLRSVSLVAFSLSVMALGFVVPARYVWAHVVLIPLGCVMAFFSAVITHNTVHVPVFTRPWMNAAFEGMLTLAYGHPACAFEPGHNLSHHRYSQTDRDVTRTSRLRFRWNLLNQLLFYPVIASSVGRSELRYVRWAWRHRRVWFWRFVRGLVAVFALYAVMVMVDWRRFILYGALPHAYAVWGIMGINFAQHDGCDPQSAANHSRNFIDPLLNWFACNNGFHTIHHLAPGLHWSLLPAAHAAVLRPHIDPALEQRSLARWCWRSFVWPGTRRTYDGRPYAPPPPTPDGDWLAGDSASSDFAGGLS